MIRAVLGAFIVAHGLLTAFIWVSPAQADAPFRATHSWLVGDARPLAAVIALVAAAGFVLAGIGFITQQAWWALTGIGAGAVALLLMTLFFNLGCWPASPSAPASSMPGSKPYRRPSRQGGGLDEGPPRRSSGARAGRWLPHRAGQIWPWLAQMGYEGRAGTYSYDLFSYDLFERNIG
jgi:hypothetical protein